MIDDQELHKRLHRAQRLVYSVEFHEFFSAVRELALVAGAVAARGLAPMTEETMRELENEDLELAHRRDAKKSESPG